jgi:hypothetical protein
VRNCKLQTLVGDKGDDLLEMEGGGCRPELGGHVPRHGASILPSAAKSNSALDATSSTHARRLAPPVPTRHPVSPSVGTPHSAGARSPP